MFARMLATIGRKVTAWVADDPKAEPGIYVARVVYTPKPGAQW